MDLSHWGQAKSNTDLKTLKEKFWSMPEQPFIGVKQPELLAGIRSLSVKSRILFYRVTINQVEINQVEIIQVLHHRHDSTRHMT